MPTEGVQNRQSVVFSLFILMIIVSGISLGKHKSAEKLSTTVVDNFDEAMFIEVQGPSLKAGVYKFFSNLLTLEQLCVTLYPNGECEQWVKGKGAPVLRSGDAVRFLSGGSVEIGKMPGARRLALGIPLDPNADGVEDLVAIPGIGEKTAQKIVRRREEKGKFRSLEEFQEFVGKRVEARKYFKIEQ